MACGLPVITSDRTACPEIAGGAALLVDPRNDKSIADAMIRIINDDNLRNDLKNKGIKRAGDFNWDKCADEHLKVFKEVVAK